MRWTHDRRHARRVINRRPRETFGGRERPTFREIRAQIEKRSRFSNEQKTKRANNNRRTRLPRPKTKKLERHQSRVYTYFTSRKFVRSFTRILRPAKGSRESRNLRRPSPWESYANNYFPFERNPPKVENPYRMVVFSAARVNSPRNVFSTLCTFGTNNNCPRPRRRIIVFSPECNAAKIKANWGERGVFEFLLYNWGVDNEIRNIFVRTMNAYDCSRTDRPCSRNARRYHNRGYANTGRTYTISDVGLCCPSVRPRHNDDDDAMKRRLNLLKYRNFSGTKTQIVKNINDKIKNSKNDKITTVKYNNIKSRQWSV